MRKISKTVAKKKRQKGWMSYLKGPAASQEFMKDVEKLPVQDRINSGRRFTRDEMNER